MTTRETGTRKKLRDAGKAELEPVLDDAELYGSIASIADQDGGKAIMSALLEDVVTSMNALAYNYQEYSYEQLVSKSAKLRASLDLFLLMKRAKQNTNDARKVLKEALGEME